MLVFLGFFTDKAKRKPKTVFLVTQIQSELNQAAVKTQSRRSYWEPLGRVQLVLGN